MSFNGTMPSGGMHGPSTYHNYLRVVLTSVMVFMMIIATPLFIRERSQPPIKYRSWTINLLSCGCSALCQFWKACYATGIYPSRNIYPYLEMVSDVLYMVVMCCFLPIFIRHYFLLRLPVLQKQLLSNQTMLDPVKYKQFSRELVLTKFFSGEKGTWMFFAINYIPCALITIILFFTTDVELIITRQPNHYSEYMTIMPVIQICISQIFLLWYAPRAPKDNFYIKIQFYIVTAISLANVIVTLALSIVRSPGMMRNFFLSTTIIQFLAVFIDLAVPLWFILTNKRYAVMVTKYRRYRSSKNSKGVTSGELDSKSVAQSLMRSTQVTSGEIISSTETGSKPEHSQVGNPTYNLHCILEKPSTYAAFCTFLSREFCMESLLFLEAVQKYKNEIKENFNLALVKSLSDKIRVDFIEPGAINEVNLPKKITSKVDDTLKGITEGNIPLEKAKKMYDHAEEHIEEMLILNHLRKFQASALYRNANAVV
ncbi:hypothetical protein BDV3_001946 [Batrachochytrium dendrobatidis]